jgi:hypothetical protein
LPRRRHVHPTGGPVKGILLGFWTRGDRDRFQSTVADGKDVSVVGIHLHRDIGYLVSGLPEATITGGVK